MIPKNIIQLYLGAETEDSKYLDHLQKGWQIAYPDWNHIYLKNKEVVDCIKEYSEEAFELYNDIGILSYRADFARLVLLHKFGGVYLDLDTRPNLPLEQYVIVSNDVLWGMLMTVDAMSGIPDGQEHRGVSTSNYLAVAETGSTFIKEMIDHIIFEWLKIKEGGKNKPGVNEFWAAKLVSTVAWGTMLLNKLDDLSDGNYLDLHTKLGYGKFGTFWISWDGTKVITRKYRGAITHIGSILLKDFMDTNPSEDPIELLSKLYSDINLHNGEIKIYSRGLYGI
jgi:hypothetical protein